MPNVPRNPGVPSLTSYGPGGGALLLSDASVAIAAFGAFFSPSWGIYQDGVAVIGPANIISSFVTATLAPLQEIVSAVGGPSLLPVIASTVDWDFKQDWPISDYPQENGAFQSYNKVELPFDIRVRLTAGGPVGQRQAFLNTCQEVASSLLLFDITTPEKVFESCNCTHIDWARSARNGVSLIQVSLWFKQINLTASLTTNAGQLPSVSGQQSIGQVQPRALSASEVAAVERTGL